MTGTAPDPSVFGPNFELVAVDGSPDWMPLSSMASPTVLMERVENTRLAIGGVGGSPREVRAVASTMALGLFSRLLSPVLGAALLGAPSLSPDPRATFLKRVRRGTIPLATGAGRVDADPRAVLEGLVLPLIPQMSRVYRLSRRVLIGNAAAAVAGACGVVEAVRPDLAEEAEDLRAALLTTPRLAGSGTPRGPFVRSSCCLIWQLPMHYICSNCVLVDAGTRMVRERDDDRAGSAGFRRRFKEQLAQAERTRTWKPS